VWEERIAWHIGQEEWRWRLRRRAGPGVLGHGTVRLGACRLRSVVLQVGGSGEE
jgi:hypothetical protein